MSQDQKKVNNTDTMLLTFSPNNYEQWKNRITNIIKTKYPIAGASLGTQSSPNFTPTKNQKDPLYLEEWKLQEKRRLEYKDSLPAVWAELMLSLSEASEQRIRQHEKYPDLLKDHSIYGLWKIIEETHITTPATKQAKLAVEMNIYHQLAQGSTDIETYNNNFNIQVRKVNTLADSLNQLKNDDLVIKYLYSLNYETFGKLVEQLFDPLHNHILPSTLHEAQQLALNWYNTRESTKRVMTNTSTTTANQAQNGNPTVLAQLSSTRSGRGRQNGRTPGRGRNQHYSSARNKQFPNSNNEIHQNYNGNNTNFGVNYNNENNKNYSNHHQNQHQRGGRSNHRGRGRGGRHSNRRYNYSCDYCKARGLTHDNHTLANCGHIRRIITDNTKGQQQANAHLNMSNLPTQLQQQLQNQLSVNNFAVFNQDGESFDQAIVLHNHSAIIMNSNVEKLAKLFNDHELLLDPGCNCSIIKIKSLLHDIVELDKPIAVVGVTGISYATHIGNILDLGIALYLPDAPANLIAFRPLKDTCNRVFDEINEKFVVTVKKTGNKYEFTSKNKSGLYTCDLREYKKTATALLGKNLVLDNEVYSTTEIRRAKDAQLLHEQLNHINDQALTILLDRKAIQYCPLTSTDLRNYRKMFGPCTACMRGKMTEDPALPTNMEKPNKGTLLHADIFFIKDNNKSKSPYLIAVESVTNYTMSAKLKSKSIQHICEAFERMINAMKVQKHNVQKIRCDNEKAFRGCEEIMAKQGVEVTFSAVGRHERRAERQIRTIKGKIRATLFGLKYKLPRKLYERLIAHVVSSMNITPNTKTSPLTPREILTGVNIDMKTMLRGRFGDFVMVKIPNVDGRDIEQPQAEVGVIVGRDTNSPGSYWIYLLDRGLILSRNQFHIFEPTYDLIQKMNDLAKDDLDFKEDPDLSDSFADTLVSPTDPDEQMQSTHDTLINDIVSNDAGMIHTTQTEPTEVTVIEHIQPHLLHRGETSKDDDIANHSNYENIDPEPIHHDIQPVETNIIDTTQTTEEVVTEQNEKVITQSNNEKIDESIATRRSSRANRTSWRDQKLKKEVFGYEKTYGLHYSVKEGLRKCPDKAIPAIVDELKQMIDLGVWQPVERSSLTYKEVLEAVPVVTFLKDKINPANGEIERVKARSTMGGNRLNTETFENENLRSPTVDMSAVFAFLAISATKKWKVSTTDIKGAFLKAFFPKHIRVIMKLGPELTSIIVNIPNIGEQYKRYLNADGTVYVRVYRALYGHPLSAKLWHKHLSNTLINAGWKQTMNDECIFTLHKDKEASIITIHVDDLLHVYSNEKLQQYLETALRKAYKDINVQKGDDITYLGMKIHFDRKINSVEINQKVYMEEMMKVYNVQGFENTPANATLFNRNKEPAKPIDSGTYSSMLMKIMYLAKRTRPDLLLTVAYLATKSQNPTIIEWKQLMHLLKYINATKDYGIVLRPNSLRLHVSCDASFNIHDDAKSHSGIIIQLGAEGGPIFAKSVKQKIVSRSSTEAELNALYDAIPEVEWLRGLLLEALPNEKDLKLPAIIEQDNKSSIILSETGEAKRGKTKHMQLRLHYIREAIGKGGVNLKYSNTNEILADYLTKPLVGQQFQYLRDRLVKNT